MPDSKKEKKTEYPKHLTQNKTHLNKTNKENSKDQQMYFNWNTIIVMLQLYKVETEQKH